MISVPVPYGNKPSGVERPPPKRGPRPYKERLAEAPKLIEETQSKPGSFQASLPFLAHILMIVGALAPIAYAPSVFRASFFGDFVRAIYPFGYGLTLAAGWVEAGWVGGLLLAVACVVGLLFGEIARRPKPFGSETRVFLLFLICVAIVSLALGYFLREFIFHASANALGAAWVFLTAGAGLYGARESVRKSSFYGAVGGAIALFSAGRFVIAGIALMFLAMADREFPGQNVARYPWLRSQVAIEPLPVPSEVEFGEAPPIRPRGPAWAASLPFATSIVLLIGAAAPLAYNPIFGHALLGDFVLALYPLSLFVIVSSDLLFMLPFGAPYILGTSLFGFAGARFAAGRRRRGAVLAGGIMLLVGLRPLLGLVALFFLFLSWNEYRAPSDKAPARGEAAPEAAGH